MPYPVHILDKMIQQKIRCVAKVDFYKPRPGSQTAITEQEFDELIFGLGDLGINNYEYYTEGGGSAGCEFVYIQLDYAETLFEIVFAFFDRPQDHLNGGKAHYMLYTTKLPNTAERILNINACGNLETADVPELDPV